MKVLHDWSSEELDFNLLVLIASRPNYCYGLVNQVQKQLRTPVVSTRVYRRLGKLEEQGYVVAWWAPQENSPPRKVYRLTKEGQVYLQQLVPEIKAALEVLDRLLVRAAQHAEVP